MKKLFLVGMVAALAAQANELDVLTALKNSKQKFITKVHGETVVLPDDPIKSPPPKEIEPIRMASAKVSIIKLHHKRMGNSYGVEITPICDVDMPVPVVDLRGEREPVMWRPGMGDCTTELTGIGEVQVSVMAHIDMSDYNAQARKNFDIMYGVSLKKGEDSVPFPNANDTFGINRVSSREMTLGNVIFALGNSRSKSFEQGESYETFGVSADFTDVVP